MHHTAIPHNETQVITTPYRPFAQPVVSWETLHAPCSLCSHSLQGLPCHIKQTPRTGPPAARPPGGGAPPYNTRVQRAGPSEGAWAARKIAALSRELGTEVGQQVMSRLGLPVGAARCGLMCHLHTDTGCCLTLRHELWALSCTATNSHMHVNHVYRCTHTRLQVTCAVVGMVAHL